MRQNAMQEIHTKRTEYMEDKKKMSIKHKNNNSIQALSKLPSILCLNVGRVA
jgi:hypothetical protein